MTRENAIRWMTVLKQSKINWIGDTNKIAGIKAECEKAEQEAFDMAIEALQADAVQGWIPVSERLPSDGGNYLITVEDLRLGHIGEHTVTMADFYAKEKKWNSAVDVIAWMPLPETYKGGVE